MFYVLQYPNFTALNYAESMCDRDNTITKNPVFNWLQYGKLPESIAIYPSYSIQYDAPDGKNRYISDVTVFPIPTATMAITVAEGATSTITNPLISSAQSTSDATATATVAQGGVLTITGVAAGDATVTVYDKANDLIYTITVTVEAAG